MLRDLFLHMQWSDARVWTAALAAPHDDVVREKLHHVHDVQRSFYNTATGRPQDSPQFEDFPSLEAMRDWGRATHADWLAYIDSNPDLEQRPPVRFRERLAGKGSRDATVGEIVMQVALHSMYHRGQVNTRLREIGGEPPLCDYIVWVWRGRPAAEW